MLTLKYDKGKVFADDQSTKDLLINGHFGVEKAGRLELLPEEALYLIDVRNAECIAKGKRVGFNSLASQFMRDGRSIARYFAYKDWRDRGLIAKSAGLQHKEPNKIPVKEYPAARLEMPHIRTKGRFFKNDLMTIIEDKEKGRLLYEQLWFGQYGSYKIAGHGSLNKLDIYETVFLMKHKVLSVEGYSQAEIIRAAKAKHADFSKLYDVYADWREHGYVIKTGFKFGTHFRVYFPGAKPTKAGTENWIHSKHVIHVFPKNAKLLISEWSRAVRVAHSVRKTFILAIPGSGGGKRKRPRIDLLLYHRHGGVADSPESDPPKYAMLALSEEEYIGGTELSSAIAAAKEMKMDVMLAIMDRETSITYYRIQQIMLPNSTHEYYEIDWVQP
ncbi:MAG: tRNA-intron lyase [Candidatus Micrarchaeaceae archaeon]